MARKKQSSLRQFLRFFLICGVFAVLIYGVYKFGLLEKMLTPNKGKVVGMLAYSQGAVEYKSPGGDWKRAISDIDIYQADLLEVVGDGRVIINFTDGGSLRLNDNSLVVFSSLKPNDIAITLVHGDLYARVPPNFGSFQIKADGVVYQSFGTAFRVTDTKLVKGVVVYQSTVKIIQDNKEEVLVPQGRSYFLKNIDDPSGENLLGQIEIESLKQDDFLMWNRAQDKSIPEYKKNLGVLNFNKELGKNKNFTEDEVVDDKDVADKVTASLVAKEKKVELGQDDGELVLEAEAVDKGIKFTWQAKDFAEINGYKILRSVDKNPEYPGSEFKYINNSQQYTYIWKIKDGKKYNFRVCLHKIGGCGVYSNNVEIFAPKKEITKEIPKPITDPSIILIASELGKVSWSSSQILINGVQVVWSKYSLPTYPARNVDNHKYVSDPAVSITQLTPFDGSGVYYVRVCRYKDDACLLYSNEIKISL